MASGAAQVDETALSKEDEMTSAGHGVAVDLGLNIDNALSVSLQPGNIDFDIEVANVGDDSILRHSLKMLSGDDVPVAGGSDKDIAAGSSVLHGGDLVASHSGLEGVDGINFSDQDASTVRLERLRTLIIDEDRIL